LHYR